MFSSSSLEYVGGVNLRRKNFKTYSGRQDTRVITTTFQKKSFDLMKSQSENARRHRKNILISGFSHENVKDKENDYVL